MNTNDTISKVPILVFMEDHNICFCMKDWHHLGRKAPINSIHRDATSRLRTSASIF